MTDPIANSVWEYVRPSDFRLPPSSISETFKGGLAGLWHRLKPAEQEPDKPVKAESDLQLLPLELLDRIAPLPTWQTAAVCLEAALERSAEEQNANVRYTLVIGLPHSGNQEILHQLAQAQNGLIVSPPSADQILSQDPTWLNPAKNCDGVWVLPALERCFLRHPSGLALVRRLFQLLHSGDVRPGIIGIDNWAWAYLSHVVRVDSQRSLTAQAFDHERLSRWFRECAAGLDKDLMLFRQSDSGAWIWEPPAEVVGKDNSAEMSAFLKHLAAYSRGIPGVAWSFWRNALRSSPDEALFTERDSKTARTPGTSIWVLPWDKVKRSMVSASLGSEHKHLLHTLLIHNGFSSDLLLEILPFDASAVFGALSDLETAGVIDQIGDIWRVSASAYPAVRQFLDSEGYLIDNF